MSEMLDRDSDRFDVTQDEVAAAVGLPDRRWVYYFESRAIRKLWRERARLQRIMAGRLPRPQNSTRRPRRKKAC